MHRARDRVEFEQWLEQIDDLGTDLGLSESARQYAMDLFLADVPDTDRSRRAALAASVYAGSLVAGERQTQGAVAEAASVSRLAIQQHWKERLELAGLEAPSW